MINPADDEINIFLTAGALLFFVAGALLLVGLVLAIRYLFKLFFDYFDMRMRRKLSKFENDRK
jgi:hypothetical protein